MWKKGTYQKSNQVTTQNQHIDFKMKERRKKQQQQQRQQTTTTTSTSHSTHVSKVKHVETEYTIQTVSMNVLYIQHCSTLSTCFLFWFSFNIFFFFFFNSSLYIFKTGFVSPFKRCALWKLVTRRQIRSVVCEMAICVGAICKG